ncbi:MAG: GNAT family N-acetyltransferase [Candidatus Aenigmarchaeota archaeon]|nr:GNAT family N-acetyltransferase [Candidatus Aenigmarchaeota archaeon]
MITIRNFRPDDIEKISFFKSESVKMNFPGCEFNPVLYRKLLLKSVSMSPDYVKVAEDNGNVVGYVWFRVIDSSVGMFGRFEHLFVDQSCRGKGVGRMLMESAEDFFRKSGIKTVKLTVTTTNEDAMKLYEKLGYRTKRYKMEKDL